MIEAAVAAAFMVPLGRVRARSRGAEVAFARQVAMYLAHVGFGMSLKATARLFHRDRRTAAHACRRVEERRDDPAIDRQLHMLEATCADLARGTLTLPQAQS
jgi:chromosomal replication initiation ATPase DnaA